MTRFAQKSAFDILVQSGQGGSSKRYLQSYDPMALSVHKVVSPGERGEDDDQQSCHKTERNAIRIANMPLI